MKPFKSTKFMIILCLVLPAITYIIAMLRGNTSEFAHIFPLIMIGIISLNLFTIIKDQDKRIEVLEGRLSKEPHST